MDCHYLFQQRRNVGKNVMILKVIQKVELEQSKGVFVVPYWPTQPWWPKITKMSVDTLVLSRERGRPTLTRPFRPEEELPKMKLLAGLICGENSGRRECQARPSTS